MPLDNTQLLTPKLEKTRNQLALCHLIYGAVGLSLILLAGLTSFLALLISRTTLTAIVITFLRPIALKTLGYQEGDAFIEWLLLLLRFSPILFGCLTIVTSLIVGLITSLPFLTTSYGLYKRKEWIFVPATIVIILAIPVFPFGTLLSLYTAYYLYKKSSIDTNTKFNDPKFSNY